MKGRPGRLVLLLAGIVFGQAALYGPSLAGRKILLPLDILAVSNYYLPRNTELGPIPTHNIQLADLVLAEEPNRRFLGSELRSGRFPLWNPYQYAGAPTTPPKFSPFLLLSALVASPKVIPWIELLKAIVGGVGTYVFCRRVLQVAFWPAAITGWCYPLTGFFVLWQGLSAAATLVWLPWLFLAVNETVRGRARHSAGDVNAGNPLDGEGLEVVGGARGATRPTVAGEQMAAVSSGSPWAAPALSVVSWLVLVSGQLDIAGQALLAAGLYAVWCLVDTYRKEWRGQGFRRAVLKLAAGWTLGFLLAAPYILPVLDYTHTGVRMGRRSAGTEERPPVGLAALPQVVLPNMYGTTEMGSLPVFPKREGGLSESNSAAYAGLLATLFVAPLAWCSRRHRCTNIFWALLGFFALSWSLNVPGVVNLLRLPVLNLMSHNRYVFAASFAILALGATGLDVLWQGQFQRRWWFWVPMAMLGGLCAWCAVRAAYPPEPIRSQLEAAIREGGAVRWVRDLVGVRQVQGWFARMYSGGAILCGLGLAGGLFLWIRGRPRPWFVLLLGVVMVADLIGFGFGRASQSDPALSYPPIPALEEAGRSAPCRIAAYNCLPANLASVCGLRDIRGYDGVDPARFVNLLASVADPRSPAFPYAQAQWLTPKTAFTPEGDIRLPPVLDMLGVRYVVFRGSPARTARPAFQSPDYWVLVNSNALGRAFIPRRVETIREDEARLEKLTQPKFNPREVAYVELAVNLPAACRGSAEIVDEVPTRVTMFVRMETPGLVVLADRWDRGWRAYLNGKRVPILRTNHAVRGVVVPAGLGTLEFRYAPASFAWGLGLAGLAAFTLLSWLAVIAGKRRHAGAHPERVTPSTSTPHNAFIALSSAA
jgi:hypothetical protein